jgi:hypothetical protein
MITNNGLLKILFSSVHPFTYSDGGSDDYDSENGSWTYLILIIFALFLVAGVPYLVGRDIVRDMEKQDRTEKVTLVVPYQGQTGTTFYDQDGTITHTTYPK